MSDCTSMRLKFMAINYSQTIYKFDQLFGIYLIHLGKTLGIDLQMG